nr:immunoglobulin-like domain-containing protein [Listeria booriae]
MPDGTIVSKTANAQGTATFFVTDLKVGDIITATQTKNGITSKQAAITVTPDKSEVVTVTTEGFMIGKDSYIKGTYTGDVAKLAIEVNGTLLQKINVPNSPYQYYAKGKVTVATDQVYVITYDSNDNQLEKTKVDVKSQIKSTLTPNPFYIGKDNYVTGQLVGDITKFSLTVNGIEYTKINVTTAPDFKYYANNVIKNATDIVQINGYSATGNLLDSKPVTIANTETGKITSTEAFKIGKDSYITATYTGDITKAELQVNGTALQRIGVTNGTIKYYAKTNITNTADEVKLVTYNSAGQRADSKIITISSSTGKITANPVKIGDSYLTGTATGDIAKVALRVNGVTQTSVAFMQIDGIYKYYIKSLHLKPTDEVKIIGLDGRSNEIHTSDVTITN